MNKIKCSITSRRMFYLTLTVLRGSCWKDYVNKYTLVQLCLFTINGIYLNAVDYLVNYLLTSTKTTSHDINQF